MGLSVEQEMLVEQRLANESKSTGLTYVLWFFFGGLGVHRFYLGHVLRGLAMLGLLLVGVVTLPIGAIPLGVLAIWLLLDLFFIPSLVNERRQKMRARMGREMERAAPMAGAAPGAMRGPLTGRTCANCRRPLNATDDLCVCGMPVRG